MWEIGERKKGRKAKGGGRRKKEVDKEGKEKKEIENKQTAVPGIEPMPGLLTLRKSSSGELGK